MAFAQAPKVAVYPPDVNLETARDRQSFVVQLTQPDGLTRDVTDRCRIAIADPTLTPPAFPSSIDAYPGN